MALMQRVAQEALDLIGEAEGVLVALVSGDSLVFTCGCGFLEERVGDSMPLDGSLGGIAVRTGRTLRCDDVRSDDRVNLDQCVEYGIASALCVPLMRGAEPVGVLDVSSTRPGAFDEADELKLARLAEFSSVVIAASADILSVTNRLLDAGGDDLGGMEIDQLAVEERFVANVLSPGTVGDLEARRRIEGVLETNALSIVLQPVFELFESRLFALEALARFPVSPPRPPDQWFAEAHAVDLGVELEVAAVRNALSLLDQLPAGVALCVNAGPKALASEEVLHLIKESDPSRIVIELTEQVRVDDYVRLSVSIKRLRLLGVRLAIDDTGAGFASLAHILKLDPDLIKLDRDLTSRIDQDPVRRALAASLVAFAGETGADIIAEGIETPGELDVLRELGIRYGQGYLLGRPSPLESVDLKPSTQLPAP